MTHDRAARKSFLGGLKHYFEFHTCTGNKFSTICFLLLVRSNSNSPRSLEGFRQTPVPNFIQIRQRVNNFPKDPYCNIARFRQRNNVAESRQFLQRGSHPLSNPVEISPQSSSKTFLWSRRYEIDRAKRKNNIAENSFALGFCNLDLDLDIWHWPLA